jgi:pimeloyl-ACP methyl ester carboxylesterase
MALYLRQAGPVAGPGLVFLHGLWLSGSMWQPQLELLSDEYHCLAPDLPEHGKSTDIGLLTLDNTSRLVADLIRKHTPNSRAHVVGLSLGGLVALGLLRDRPEVVDHVLVSGTAPAGRLGPLIAVLSKLGTPLLAVLNPAPLYSLGLRRSRIPPPYLDLLQEDVHHLQPGAILHFVGEFLKMEVPRGARVPLLVTVGGREDLMVKRAARSLSRMVPATLATAPGLGHLWNLEAPRLFTETVSAWIADRPLPDALAIGGQRPESRDSRHKR